MVKKGCIGVGGEGGWGGQGFTGTHEVVILEPALLSVAMQNLEGSKKSSSEKWMGS